MPVLLAIIIGVTAGTVMRHKQKKSPVPNSQQQTTDYLRTGKFEGQKNVGQ